MRNRYIAHIRKKDKIPQYLWEHLKEVSSFSGEFAEKIGLKEAGELIGLLHDLGKASAEFQRYILSATGIIDPDEDDYIDATKKKGKIDHSTAGAQVIYRNLCKKGSEGFLVAQLLSLCIASHHSGLIDCLLPDGTNNLIKRIEKSDEKTHTEEALPFLQEVEENKFRDLLSAGIEKQLCTKLKSLKENIDSQETITFKYGLLIRFLFSCLIDADRLSTANFEFTSNTRLRNFGQYRPWETLIQRLNDKIKDISNKAKRNEVNELRNQVSQACLVFSTKSQGIYQLTVPTGGGKTLASLRFALNQAAHHNLDRIFYIIPFTSIIDQNADEVRKILEDKDENGQYLDRVLLEHHSNLTPEEETRRHNLLSENWDAPVVFTTQVQFLETIFGSGTRSVRRMHQLSNSVIIFDEVQTIPIRCVHLFNVVIRFLVHNCGSTVVLCTATQPLLDKVEPAQRSLPIRPEQRIIANEKVLFDKLRRVKVFDRRKIGGWSDEEVAELTEQELREMGSVLVIVNTKSSARSLYQTIAKKHNTDVYHLSTSMCPAHRLDVLNKIKEKLSKKQPVICVSTQLIEAGVDIDFGAVIRYLAGLDSIVQAAGRCNRNGEHKHLGHVWIINPAKENIDQLTDIKIGQEVAVRILDEFKDDPERFGNDPLGLGVMERYYEYYFYARKDEMSYKVGKNSPVGRNDDLFNLLSVNSLSVAEHQRTLNTAPSISFRQSFQTAAKSFYAIDSPRQGVVVSYGKTGKQIVNDLCGTYDIEKQYRLLKKAQRYSVGLLPHEFEELVNNNAIREAQKESGIFYLDGQYYSDQFGWSKEIVNELKTLIL